MADRTPTSCAKYAVVRHMSCDAANDGALDAAFGLSRPDRTSHQRKRESRSGDHCFAVDHCFHVKSFPFCCNPNGAKGIWLRLLALVL